MKKMKIIYWLMMILGFTLAGCGQSAHPAREVQRSSKEEIRKETLSNFKNSEDSLPDTFVENDVVPPSGKEVAPPPKKEDKKNSTIHLGNPMDPRNYIIKFTADGVSEERRLLDVRQINPYKDISYPMDYISQDSLEYQYNLRSLSQSEKISLLAGMRINTDAYRDDPDYLKMAIISPLIECRENVAAIAFQRIFSSNEEDVLGTQGIVILYNEQGMEIRRIEDKKDGFEGIRLSEDGKYLMQQYGFTYGEDGGGQLDRGFRFYDTKTGEMIFEWVLGKDQFLEGYDIFFDTHLATCFRREGNLHEKYVIDFINKEIYMKSMDRWKYSNNHLGYRETLFPTFLKTRSIKDLLKDGFKKIK